MLWFEQSVALHVGCRVLVSTQAWAEDRLTLPLFSPPAVSPKKNWLRFRKFKSRPPARYKTTTCNHTCRRRYEGHHGLGNPPTRGKIRGLRAKPQGVLLSVSVSLSLGLAVFPSLVHARFRSGPSRAATLAVHGPDVQA
jgi:hypothetical protein